MQSALFAGAKMSSLYLILKSGTTSLGAKGAQIPLITCVPCAANVTKACRIRTQLMNLVRSVYERTPHGINLDIQTKNLLHHLTPPHIFFGEFHVLDILTHTCIDATDQVIQPITIEPSIVLAWIARNDQL